MAVSPLLQIPQLAPNQSNKEVTINDGVSILERSLNDIRSVNLSAANVELNITDYTRAFLFNCTGHSVTRTLTVPNSKRLFAVYNAGSAVITVEAKDSGGLTAEIPTGSFVVLFNSDGDVRKISDSAASGQVSAFLSLPDTPNSFAGQAGRALVVNGTEDGMDFGTISVGFLDLTDGPSSYSGQAGKAIRVNPGANGIEFVNYISSFVQLTDTPADFIGQAGRMLVVSAGEDELHFEDIPEPVIRAIRYYPLPNAGFEEGDLTHWTVPLTSGSIWTVDAGFGLIAPDEGDYLAYHGFDQGDEPTSIGYEVDLLDQAYPEEIDGESEIEISIAMASPTNDYGQMQIDFFDESDDFLSTATSPLYPGTEVMIERRFRADVPEGARKVMLLFNVLKNPDDSVDPDNVTFAFDNLMVSIRLETDQISTFIELFDTPLSYEGSAGKMILVNSNEDGVEFADAPTSVEFFVDLLDVPANFSGQALRYVRVNSGETGLEFFAPSFLHASDTPSSFSGQSGRLVKVNIAENALEFGTLVESLPALTGNAAKVLAVNGTADGIEWVTQSGGGGSSLTIKTETDNYELVVGDVGSYIRMDKATAVSLIVPSNGDQAIPVGSVFPIRQVGAGKVTIVAGSGVTISTAETLSLRKQNSGASLIKTATNAWDLVGDLELA